MSSNPCNYIHYGGAGTNLKVGAPVRSESDGGRRKIGGGVVSLHFLALKAQAVISVSAFVMVSTVWSVSCLLFVYSRYFPRTQPFVKVGARAPVPMESAPLLTAPLQLQLRL